MESQSAGPQAPNDVSEVVQDAIGKPIRIETEIGHSPDVKVEWLERPQSDAYVLLTPAEARALAAKLRHAIGLPITGHFRESVFDTRWVAELSVHKGSYSGVFLSRVDGGASGTFKQLGQFIGGEALELAAALEAAASALDKTDPKHRRTASSRARFPFLGRAGITPARPFLVLAKPLPPGSGPGTAGYRPADEPSQSK
jgi:hypothetical protein